MTNLFTQSVQSFDLMKKSSQVGTLYHKFTSLKLESDQVNILRSNRTQNDKIKDAEQTIRQKRINERLSDRISHMQIDYK